MTSRHHGRQFLVGKLPGMDVSLRDAIARHIFETNDRFTKSMVTTKPDSREIALQCGSWAGHAQQFLAHLDKDIDIALEIENWDRNILGDVLALIDFLEDCCGSYDDLVSGLSKNGTQKITVRLGPPKSYSDLKADLEESRRSVVIKVSKLMGHLKEKYPEDDDLRRQISNAGDDETKVPTATLRELFIFNEVHLKRKEIWSLVDKYISIQRPVEAMPACEKKIAGEDIDPSTEITSTILKILKTFENITKPEVGVNQEAERNKIAWLSRTIILFLDSRNRIILTGGSQPTCHESGLFGKAVRAIKHLRVGPEFAKVANTCSYEFAVLANKVKDSAKLEVKKDLSDMSCTKIEDLGLYERMMNEAKSDRNNKLAASTEDKPVWGWASEGSTFEPKPPCLRCQRIYPTWVLYGRPRDSDKKKTALEDMFGHSVPPTPSTNVAWAYCAETVAASKLYLLENGALALV